MSWGDQIEDFRSRRRYAKFCVFTVIERERESAGSPPRYQKYYFYRIEDYPGISAMITWGGPALCWTGNIDEARNKISILKSLHPDWHFELEELEMYGLG